MPLHSLQSLRAVAALLVLAAHAAQIDGRFFSQPVSSGQWTLGFAGVDLFFVISGFVMVYITHGKPRGDAHFTGRFVYARFTRIYPIYWFFTLLALAAYMLVPDTLNRDLADLEIWRSFTLWPIEGELPILHVGWTLTHEIYFYLAFTLFLIMPERWLPALLAVWATLVIAGSLLLEGLPAIGTLIVNPLTIEFILGALAGILICSGERRLARTALLLAALWLAAAAWLLWPDNAEAFPAGWMRVAAFGIPAALIVYGAIGLEMQGRMRPPGWLVILGDWSYALYLCHLLVLSGLVRMWVAVLPDFGPLASLAFLIVSIALSVAVAGAGFRLLEFPALKATRRLGDRLFEGPQRPRRAPAAHEDPAVQTGQAGSRDS